MTDLIDWLNRNHNAVIAIGIIFTAYSSVYLLYRMYVTHSAARIHGLKRHPVDLLSKHNSAMVGRDNMVKRWVNSDENLSNPLAPEVGVPGAISTGQRPGLRRAENSTEHKALTNALQILIGVEPGSYNFHSIRQQANSRIVESTQKVIFKEYQTQQRGYLL